MLSRHTHRQIVFSSALACSAFATLLLAGCGDRGRYDYIQLTPTICDQARAFCTLHDRAVHDREPLKPGSVTIGAIGCQRLVNREAAIDIVCRAATALTSAQQDELGMAVVSLSNNAVSTQAFTDFKPWTIHRNGNAWQDIATTGIPNGSGPILLWTESHAPASFEQTCEMDESSVTVYRLIVGELNGSDSSSFKLGEAISLSPRTRDYLRDTLFKHGMSVSFYDTPVPIKDRAAP